MNQKKFLSNAISGNKTKVINSKDNSKLDMTGKKLQYCVILNTNGKVIDMKVSNGKWIASLNGKAVEDLTIDDLENGNLDDYDCETNEPSNPDNPNQPDKPSDPDVPSYANCTFDGDMVQGAEYVNGQYTYRYKQQGGIYNIKFRWSNMSTDGWGVALTDQKSTDPVTSQVCTYINNKPVVSTSCMFYQTKATSINLENINTSNIINMGGMFYESKAKEIKGLNNFDTSNVTNMNGMFRSSPATSLDLSSFDTNNVKNMGAMFFGSRATSLDLSKFNTSKVTDMGYMFYTSKATSLDVSNFDTSNVTDMSSMFYDCVVPTLDLRNFNTSKVTNMHHMFYANKASSLNLTSFDTRNVTDMGGMFSSSKVTSLDLSSFDISSSTNITDIFRGAQVKTGYAKNDTIATLLNNSSYKPSGLVFKVK